MNAMILQESSRGLDAFTAESSLLRRRILFLNEEVNADSCNRLIEYLLHLDMEEPGKEITLCINSPGGEVGSGLAVCDVMQMIQSPIRTVCTGLAASMAAVIFSCGEKREMLPRSKVMIHEPRLSGSSGIKRAMELEQEAAQMVETRDVLAGILAENCGRSIEEVMEKIRGDFYMDLKAAEEFGIATGVCKKI